MATDEQLRLEHATLIEQYRATRAEIDGLLEASRQILSFCVTVISAFLGLSYVTQNTDFAKAFLVFPLVLYGIVLVQLRYLLLMRQASAYISKVIAPRMRTILQTTGDSKAGFSYILNWEETRRTLAQQRGGWLLLPVLGSSYGLPLLAAVLFVAAYLHMVGIPNVDDVDKVLLLCNGIALLYCVVLGIRIEFTKLGQDGEFVGKTPGRD